MANEYLNRTIIINGNLQVWTWAGWVKRQNLGNFMRLFEAGQNTSNFTTITWQGDNDTLEVMSRNTGQSGNTIRVQTLPRFRDLSSWYHVVVSMNTTQTLSSDRCKIYINGVRITRFEEDTQPSLNYDTKVNELGSHNIGVSVNSSSDLKANIFDILFVDGQELTPDVFGFYKDGDGYMSSGTTGNATDFRPGQWMPHSPSKIKKDINRRGGFGVNGFYLPMNDSSNPGADFHCAPNSIIKLKGEDLPQPRNGAPTTSDAYVSELRSDPYAANLVLAVPGISTATGANLVTNGSFDSNVSGWTAVDATLTWNAGRAQTNRTGGSGYTAYQQITVVSGQRYTVSGLIDSTGGGNRQDLRVLDNLATSGGSILLNASGTNNQIVQVNDAFTATGTTHYVYFVSDNTGTGGFDNIVVKQEDAPRDYSADIKGSGTNKTLTASGQAGVGYELGNYYGSAMTFDGDGDEFTIPANVTDLQLGGGDFTIESWIYPRVYNSGNMDWIGKNGGSTASSEFEYGIFSDGRVAFYHSNGSTYSNTGVYGLILPADTAPVGQWTHIVGERHGNTFTAYINGVAAGVVQNFLSGGSMPSGTADTCIGSDSATAGTNWHWDGRIQDLRIYKGVAKYKGGFDVPKPYTPVGIEAFRTTADTCKNNFATWNTLLGIGRQDQLTYSDGNLKVVSGATGGFDVTAASNMAIKGKIYCEFALPSSAIGAYIGVMKYNTNLTNSGTDTSGTSDCWIVRGDNGHKANGSTSAYGGSAFSNGDIIMMAVDIDNTSIWWGKNGTWFASGNPAANSNAGYTNLPSTEDLLVICGDNYSTETPHIIANFGQNPSFCGQTTAATNADDSGKGLFKYAPPSGFLALCTDNLPAPAIADPGKHFKTVLYTGRGTNGTNGFQSIRKVGFQPDLVWVKKRSASGDHKLIDSVRGSGQVLESSTTDQEGNESNNFTGFNSNGFDLGANNDVVWNQNNSKYIAWCWKAGGAAVSNTDGSITTQVSANQTAGFSIVKGTMTSGTDTLGHGLGKAPKMVITKQTNGTTGWYTWHTGIPITETLRLDAATDSNSFAHWVTEPTSSVFSMGSGFGSGEIYVAYCFAEIEGYSKFGSYTGNGDADGPFVYCGFKPSWVMVKKIDGSQSGNWLIHDSSRNPTNPVELFLQADRSHDEDTNTNISTDFLSNGFKIRGSGSVDQNTSAATYIFMAFAESPFQTANAK